MKAEDPSRPLPEVMTAEPVSPAEATEARAPYLSGAQDADPSRERESDPITALTDPALDDGFLSGTALSLSTAAATRESLWSLLSVRGLTVRIPALHRDYVQGRHDAEAECVRRADRIAYLNHDLDDALRAGILKPFELPADCLRILGQTHGERINTMIRNIVSNSEGQPHLIMSEEVENAMNGLREFMFDRVYRDGWRDPEEARCDYVLRHLFEYYCAHPGEMPEEFVMIGYRDGTERSVCDFLSCMTDRYATRKFRDLFVPSAFPAF